MSEPISKSTKDEKLEEIIKYLKNLPEEERDAALHELQEFLWQERGVRDI